MRFWASFCDFLIVGSDRQSPYPKGVLASYRFCGISFGFFSGH